MWITLGRTTPLRLLHSSRSSHLGRGCFPIRLNSRELVFEMGYCEWSKIPHSRSSRIELDRRARLLRKQARKPFDVLAERLVSEKSRDNKTPLELFLGGVRDLDQVDIVAPKSEIVRFTISPPPPSRPSLHLPSAAGTVSKPDEVWVADFTNVRLASDFIQFGVLIDGCLHPTGPRLGVELRARRPLALNALDRALRYPPVCRSDRSCVLLASVGFG